MEVWKTATQLGLDFCEKFCNDSLEKLLIVENQNILASFFLLKKLLKNQALPKLLNFRKACIFTVENIFSMSRKATEWRFSQIFSIFKHAYLMMVLENNGTHTITRSFYFLRSVKLRLTSKARNRQSIWKFSSNVMLLGLFFER